MNVARLRVRKARVGYSSIKLSLYWRALCSLAWLCTRTTNQLVHTHTQMYSDAPLSLWPPPLAPKPGTKRISITLRERKETLPCFLLPIPDCSCGAPTSLNSRVLENGTVEYLFHCDRARGACGFTLFKGPRR